MPNQNDEWSQYEVKPAAKTANAPAPKKDEWSQYEVAPQESAPASKADTSASAPPGFWKSAAAPFIGAVRGLDPRPTEDERKRGLTSAYDYVLRPLERVVD